jgi:energy-coupling factor transport system permease protein
VNGSFLHELDPRTKLLLSALFTVVVFIIDSLYIAAAMMLMFIMLCVIVKIPLKKIFPHGKFLFSVIVFVMVLQLLFGSENGGYIVKPLLPEKIPFIGGIGSLKRDGLYTGLMLGCRLITLCIIMPLLTMTTETRLLAYGITRIGFNYKTAYIITSALNMIPVFENDAAVIIDGRRLKGMKPLERGNIFGRLREYSRIALPLVIKAMRRSVLIGNAMDARAFGAYKTRTWLTETKMSFGDYAAITLAVFAAAAAVSFNFILKRQ